MANELRVNLSGLNFRKTGAPLVNISKSITVTVAGLNTVYASEQVATTDTTLDLGDVATIGYVYLENLDDTNFVTFGEDGSSYPIKLLPGEFSVLRWNGAAIHGIADTGAVNVAKGIIEE